MLVVMVERRNLPSAAAMGVDTELSVEEDEDDDDEATCGAYVVVGDAGAPLLTEGK